MINLIKMQRFSDILSSLRLIDIASQKLYFPNEIFSKKSPFNFFPLSIFSFSNFSFNYRFQDDDSDVTNEDTDEASEEDSPNRPRELGKRPYTEIKEQMYQVMVSLKENALFLSVCLSVCLSFVMSISLHRNQGTNVPGNGFIERKCSLSVSLFVCLSLFRYVYSISLHRNQGTNVLCHV